jgi:hypothetical protein
VFWLQILDEAARADSLPVIQAMRSRYLRQSHKALKVTALSEIMRWSRVRCGRRSRRTAVIFGGAWPEIFGAVWHDAHEPEARGR